ncbi:alpha/beta hydrolase [Hoyosella subflava]|uniref:Proteinase n=1 Tax=Hoyosella subflava (strain DSM 45089 / JCM 17490 / NBRC 109087 / DQS3-9A1) TaxID=443218 RepID=F6EEK7_HOYSD|nr:alpha/beta hydrolase [Hoyosella subflava]AEF39704.1 Proteinase [Hoyosella subflava DQS3-9A1]
MIAHRFPRAARGRFTRRGFTLVVVAAFALAGCAGPGPGDEEGPEFAPATPTEFPPELASYYQQTVEWGPCDDYAVDSLARESLALYEFSCARVAVPVDYSDPGALSLSDDQNGSASADGNVAYVALARRAAEGQKIGSLVLNPGGPGVGGVQTVADITTALFGTDVIERFDIVGLDPRGVGASYPPIACRTDQEKDAHRAQVRVDMSPEGIAAHEAENERYAALCAERTGEALLASVGSREGARDLDIVRAVLGDEKLNFLGYSYATYLGALYAEAFPTNVRAMILDGAVDPAEEAAESVIRQGEGFQRAFDAFAEDCAAQRECALGDEPDQAVAQFRELVDPLIEQPAQTTDPRGLSYEDALTGVVQALYVEQFWPSLRTGLAELADGLGDTLLMLADIYEGRGDDGLYDNSNDAFDAIRCVDSPPEIDRETAGEVDRRYREAAPFLDDGRGTGRAPLSMCAFWPVPHTSEPGTLDIAEELPPLLVVSTTGDPATPYEAGVELADQLGAALLTFRGNTHTAVFQGIQCVDDYAARYLIEGELPGEGTLC